MDEHTAIVEIRSHLPRTPHFSSMIQRKLFQSELFGTKTCSNIARLAVFSRHVLFFKRSIECTQKQASENPLQQLKTNNFIYEDYGLTDGNLGGELAGLERIFRSVFHVSIKSSFWIIVRDCFAPLDIGTVGSNRYSIKTNTRNPQKHQRTRSHKFFSHGSCGNGFSSCIWK